MLRLERRCLAKKELTSEDMAKIIKRMKIGFDLRLNVDYKTINPASYAKESFKYENQSSSIREKEIEEYAEWVKKNKIQIEGALTLNRPCCITQEPGITAFDPCSDSELIVLQSIRTYLMTYTSNLLNSDFTRN